MSLLLLLRGVRNYTQALTDSTSLVDSTLRPLVAQRSLSDLEGATDSRSQSATSARTVIDPLGLTDSFTQHFGYGRVITDLYAGTDPHTQSTAMSRTVAESLGLGDPRTVTQTIQRTYLERITGSDAVAHSAVLNRSVLELLGLTDVMTASAPVSTTVNLLRFVPVSPGSYVTSTARLRAASVARRYTYTIAFYNAAQVLLTTYSTVPTYDSVNSWIEVEVSGIAPVGAAYVRPIVASYDQIQTGEVHYIDAVGVSEGVTGSQWALPNSGVADYVVRSQGWGRSLSDSSALSDSYNSAQTSARFLIELESVADTYPHSGATVRQPLDSVGLGDAVTRAQGLYQRFLDGINLGDPVRYLVFGAVQGPINYQFSTTRPQEIPENTDLGAVPMGDLLGRMAPVANTGQMGALVGAMALSNSNVGAMPIGDAMGKMALVKNYGEMSDSAPPIDHSDLDGETGDPLGSLIFDQALAVE